MALTSMFAKLRKLGTSWHVLCYCVWLVLACLALYQGFLAITFAASGIMKVSRCYRWQILGWESLDTKLITFVCLVTKVQ